MIKTNGLFSTCARKPGFITGTLLLRMTSFFPSGTRYFDVSELMGFSNAAAPTLCYCRVFSHDQKPDLDRQQELLEAYCSAKGWRTQVIRDLGSGMNYWKKHKKMLETLQDVVSSQD